MKKYTHENVFYSLLTKKNVETIQKKITIKNGFQNFMEKEKLTKDDLINMLNLSKKYIDNIVKSGKITENIVNKLKTFGYDLKEIYIENLKNSDYRGNWYKTNFKYNNRFAKFLQKNSLSPKDAANIFNISTVHVHKVRFTGKISKNISKILDNFESIQNLE